MAEDLQRLDSTIQLQSGHTLAYAEYGDPQGAPVLLLHGTPGSRLINPAVFPPAAAGKRIICPDRPGYGNSSFHAGWGYPDWPADVEQLVATLGLEQFALIGISGGGPHAAAYTYRFPERVTSLTLLCSPAPLQPDRPGADVITSAYEPDEEIDAARAMTWPDFLAWFVAENGPETPDAEQWATNTPPMMPPADHKVRSRPEVQLYLRRLLGGAFRQGMTAFAYDCWLLAHPWGFNPQDIAVQTYLWHGEEDRNVPIERGRYLAATIPNCRARFYPGEGHAFFFDHWPEIFAALAS